MNVPLDHIVTLLNDLSEVQSELLTLLREKSSRLTRREPHDVAALHEREEELTARLQSCHQRRQAMLSEARDQGLPSDSIAHLVEALPANERGPLRSQVREATGRMRLLQHHSLANWVLAQQSLMHVSQLLEIIATGGRMQPTYGNSSSAHSCGGLLNSEA